MNDETVNGKAANDQASNSEQNAELSPPQNIFAGYADKYQPMGEYAVLIGVFHVLAAGLFGAAKDAGRPLPERIAPHDLLLLSVATHKVSRILAKDWVTSPLRAPFVRNIGSAGAGEAKEEARQGGMKQAVGELITCPFCMAPWVALLFWFGFVFNPRAARLLGAVFSAVAASDFLQHAYDAARDKK